MRLTSPAFNSGDDLPTRFARQHGNVSPPLRFERVPDRARSLALIVKDPDAPNGTFVHWVVYNLPPNTDEILEGRLPPEALVGRNDYGELGYGGPQPPEGTHRYYFEAYALDELVPLPPGATAAELDNAVQRHLLENAQLMGRFTAG